MDNTPPYGRPGLMLIGIGVIHQLVGLAIGLGLFGVPRGHAPLIDLVRAGVVGQAEGDPMRLTLVWFLLFGFLLIFSGAALQTAKPSRGLALGLASLCGLGVLLMPTSGFWLGFVPAVQLWRQSQPKAGLGRTPALHGSS